MPVENYATNDSLKHRSKFDPVSVSVYTSIWADNEKMPAKRLQSNWHHAFSGCITRTCVFLYTGNK